MNSDSQSPLWRFVEKKARTIVPLGGGGDGIPFYYVHSIGGEVIEFHRIAQTIGTERRVYGIQPPRDKLSAELGHSVRALATHYADVLINFQPKGPLLLGGWSSGAIIALEMAQILRQRGREISLLIILDGILYNTGGGLSIWNPLYYFKLGQNLPRWIADNIAEGNGVRRVLSRIKTELKLAMADRPLLRPIVQRGSLLDIFLDLRRWPPAQAAFARALYDALERYEPTAYEGPVLVYVAKTQPLFHLLQVRAAWKKIATRVEAIFVEGTHQGMLRGSRAGILAEDLKARLANFRPASGWSADDANPVMPTARALDTSPG